MILYLKKGKRYKVARDAEVFLAALSIMRGHERLKDIAETIELRMLLGDVMIPDSQYPLSTGGEAERTKGP